MFTIFFFFSENVPFLHHRWQQHSSEPMRSKGELQNSDSALSWGASRPLQIHLVWTNISPQVSSPQVTLYRLSRERGEGERGMERVWHQSSFSEAFALFHLDVQTLALGYTNQIIAWKAVDSKWPLYKLTSSTVQKKTIKSWVINNPLWYLTRGVRATGGTAVTSNISFYHRGIII